MTDDLVLDLPVGARVLVTANLRLREQAGATSSAAAAELARAVRAWSGPGAVVVAGDLLDCDPGPACAASALAAHPELSDALAAFASEPGRYVVVLPGGTDAWLLRSQLAADCVASVTGAVVAPAVVVEMCTAGGRRSVRVEPGWRPGPGPGFAGAPDELNHSGQRLAGVVPGLWRGRTSAWLADIGQLDDASATARFVASRLTYRQFARRAWLLVLPVLAALVVRLPVALLRPAHKVAGPLLATAAAAAGLELLVLAGLAAVFVRQVWLAFSGRSPAPPDLNEPMRARARQLVAQGLDGLVTGGTGRPELTRVGDGFYANAGACCEMVSEQPSRTVALGMPSPFLATRRLGWLELEAGSEVHARLFAAQVLLPGATFPERLVARATGPTARRAGPTGDRMGPRWRFGAPGASQGPVVVATFPNGPAWPPVPTVLAPHRRNRRLAAVVVAAAGVVSVLASLSAPVAHRLNLLRQVLPLAVPQAAGALTALGGVGLLMLARGIRRGQRRAYLVCQGTLVSVAVLHLVKAGSLPATVVALAVATFLWSKRASFRAAGERTPPLRALGRLAGVALLAVAAGTLTLEGSSWISIRLHHRHIARIGWGRALLATLERTIAVRSIPLPDRLDDFFTIGMSAVTAGLVVAAAWLVFRPVVGQRVRAAGGASERARELVGRHGGGTLDYFALRSDKELYFWGETVVAYGVYGGVCLVSPDPVGPLVEREAAWRAFRQHADSRGWALAVLGASEDWLPIYRSHGMRDLYVGDEAVVRLQEFSMEGGRFKGLRQAVNRVGRHGYTISFHDPAHVAPSLAAELEAVMTKSRRGGVERGFSMTLGRIFDPFDRGLLLAVVHAPPEDAAGADRPGGDQDRRPAGPGPLRGPAVAFCQYVPAPAIEGFSLDLMRRDNGEHPNGLIDFAIVETVRHLAERGFKGLGLNFATMRAVLAGETGEGAAQRAQGWLLKRMSGSMQIESLWRFNAKFDPVWQPRYAVYDSPENALAVAMAVARAESFWELPVIGRFLVPGPSRQLEASGTAGPGH